MTVFSRPARGARQLRKWQTAVTLSLQCGARPGKLCRAAMAERHGVATAITWRPQKPAQKTGKPRRTPIGRKPGDLLNRAIEDRLAGPISLSPAGKGWSVQNLSRTYSRLRDQA